MDVHIPKAIANGLRLKKVDVRTAQEDGTDRLPDRALLSRAAFLESVMFTSDNDFLREAYQRRTQGESFSGVIYIHQLKINMGQGVQDLELIAQVAEPTDLLNQVEFLPL